MKWHLWLKRLHHITGTIAMCAGKPLPLREFVNELRAVAQEMETEAERTDNAR